jgi:hypothetical protein
MTPGCRRVRSFFSAFLASGRAALLAVMSNARILQLLPSSYKDLRRQFESPGCALVTGKAD